MHTPTDNWPSLGQPVLVAIDGGNASREAVAWAVAEAAARQTSLLLLHVCHWPYLWVPLSEVYPVIDTCGVLEDARNVFEAATDQARQVVPGVVVNTLLRTGDPARLISGEGRHACQLVLGRREDSNPTRPRRRSVTRHVIARSHRPVTLVGCNRLPLPAPAAGREVTALPFGRGAPSATTVLDVRRESPSAALLVLTTPGHRFRRTPSTPTLGRLLAMTSAPITFVRADPGQHPHGERGGD